MRIIVAPRGMGKTRSVIAWWLQDWQHRVIIVPNYAQREFVIAEVHRNPNLRTVWAKPELKGEWGRHILAPQQWQYWSLGQKIDMVMIDNLDMFLQEMFRGALVGATSTEEWEVQQIGPRTGN